MAKILLSNKKFADIESVSINSQTSIDVTLKVTDMKMYRSLLNVKSPSVDELDMEIDSVGRKGSITLGSVSLLLSLRGVKIEFLDKQREEILSQRINPRSHKVVLKITVGGDTDA